MAEIVQENTSEGAELQQTQSNHGPYFDHDVEHYRQNLQKASENYSHKDLDAILATYPDDIQYTDFGLDNVVKLDKSSVKTFLQSFFGSIEDLFNEVISMNVTSDKEWVVVEFKVKFKYVKDCEYFPVKQATGKEVVGYGLSYFHTDHDMAKEIRRYVKYYFDGNAPQFP